jgi:hypothetical protein
MLERLGGPVTGAVGRSIGRTALQGCALALLSVSPTVRLSCQDTSRIVVPGARVVATDTAHHIGPGGAFWRSLVLPGWGQSATGRHLSGALFTTWEGVTAMMTLKAQREANYLARIGGSGLKLKRQEVQDWTVLWVFNHLFSGAEAYVAAHLQDFPKELHLQAVPGGVRLSLPLPGP